MVERVAHAPGALIFARERYAIGSIVTAVGVLGLATFGYRYLSFQEFSNDHFVHLALAQQITLGALPVRDFVDPGLPLMAALSAVAQVLLGSGLHAELVLISCAFAVASALTGFIAARASGSIAIGLAAGMLPLLVYPASYSYPKLLPYAAALAAAWVYARRPTQPRLIAVGAIVAAAFLLRHDHGVILGSGALAAVAARHGVSRQASTAFAGCLAAALVVASPYLVWIQMQEGIGAYFRDGAAFSKREAEKATWERPTFAIDSSRPLFARLARGPVVNIQWQREVPDAVVERREREHGLTRLDLMGLRSWQYELSDWSPAALRRLVADPVVRDTNGIDRSEFTLQVEAPAGARRFLTRVVGPGEGLRLRANAVAALFYVVWLAPLAAAAVLVRRWARVTERVRTVALMAIVIQLAMNMTMLRDPLDTRIRDVLVPTAVLLAFVCGYLVRAGSGWPARAGAKIAAAIVVGVPLVAAAALGEAGERIGLTGILGGPEGVTARAQFLQHDFEPPNERTGTLPARYQPIVDYLRSCTPAGGRIFTMTFAPELFFYTGAGFAGGHASLTPGYYVTERHASLMLDRLGHENVPFVIQDTDTMGEMPREYPRVTEFVSSRYREIARYPVGTEKSFVILADAARPVAGRYGSKDLPCFAAGRQS